jgi:hypothetical protein
MSLWQPAPCDHGNVRYCRECDEADTLAEEQLLETQKAQCVCPADKVVSADCRCEGNERQG